MSAKIFEGFSSDRELEVRGAEDGSQVDLLIRRAGTGIFTTGIAIAPSDAPALALAVLEAAGYGEEVVTDGSPDGHIQVAKYYLYEGVKAHASITAEARERAEFEAEALELFKASGAYGSDRLFLKFSDLEETTQSAWLAIARRAREINKKEGQ